MYQSAQKNNPLSTQFTKTLARKILPMPPLFAAAVLQCRSWIRILCRKRNANSAGFKTGRNAAITQSKRNATLLFEAQFAFSNSVPHFFSLPHMMLILCFWPFLRFWAQNAPNPTRFCTFALFSGLERWHEAENSLFSTQKEKYILKPNLNIFYRFFRPPNLLHLLEHVPEKVLDRGEILKVCLIALDKSKLYMLQHAWQSTQRKALR